MKFTVAVVLLLLSSQLCAYEQTFESCSLTTWEIFHAINSFVLGVPESKEKSKAANPKNVEVVYDLASKEGLETAYITGHMQYKQCSAEVGKGTGQPGSPKERSYRDCAIASANRINVLIRIAKGVSIEETKRKMPQQVHGLIDVLYRTAQESNLVRALAMSADSHMSCVTAAEKAVP